eukprot:3313084-Amphidinium_carterae.1
MRHALSDSKAAKVEVNLLWRRSPQEENSSLEIVNRACFFITTVLAYLVWCRVNSCFLEVRPDRGDVRLVLLRHVSFLRLGLLEPRQLASSFWAVATLTEAQGGVGSQAQGSLWWPPPMIPLLASLAAEQADAFSHQDIANCLWAVAKL